MPGFSNRSTFEHRPNAWSARVAEARASGATLLDLTESNPTRCDLLPSELNASNGQDGPVVYQAEPTGLHSAREAVSAYYKDMGVSVSPEQIVLTASTSEAYSLIFKLLLNPGESILIPRPSYPLFDFLAQLESVQAVHYRAMDAASLEAGLIAGPRAALIVHPNNPTGDYVPETFRTAILDALAESNGSLIADEVFYDYCRSGEATPSFAGCDDILCFTLSGLSKVCGLPGHKCSWIVVSGPEPQKQAALSRLECMGDTYLSVSASVQHALPALLAQRHGFQHAVRTRIQTNWDTLRAHIDTTEPTQGGWSAVVRLPPGSDDERMAIEVLEKHQVLVHPGYLFDYETHDRWVLSLLPKPTLFSQAVERLKSVL